MEILEPYPYESYFPKIEFPERVREWKFDTDVDDLFDMAEENADGTLNIQIDYKVVTNILLSIYGNVPAKENEAIVEYLEEATEQGVDHMDAINAQLNNIVYLYNELNNFKTVDYNDLPFALYRGFRTNTALPLFARLKRENKMKIGSYVHIPTFMSTSMIEETSLRFTGDNYILWKIIVPVDKMNIFKYTNISDADYNILGNFDLFNSEAEILINIGTTLKCIDIINSYTSNYRFPKADGTFEIKTKKCQLYVYEFVGYKDVDVIEHLKTFH